MKIDRIRGVVEFAVTGTLTLAVIEEAFSQFRASAPALVFRGFVWDLREADISEVNLGVLREGFQKQPLSLPKTRNMRSAVVVGHRYGTGVGKLWIKSGEIFDHLERKVFTDIEVARDWVSRSERT